jgi:hypothetical protein
MSNRAYDEIRTLIEQRGGTMKYEKEGYEFGAWVIRLGGRTAIIEAPGIGSFPKLDRLYVPKIKSPRGWEDYTNQLVPDAEAKLWAMLKIDPTP